MPPLCKALLEMRNETLWVRPKLVLLLKNLSLNLSKVYFARGKSEVSDNLMNFVLR